MARYDATFNGEELGIALAAFGMNNRVVRVTSTHPVGVPYIGDQVVGINGVSLLGLADTSKIGKDILGYIGQ